MGIRVGAITEWADSLLASYKIPFSTGSLTRLIRLDTLADWILKTYAGFDPSGIGAISEAVSAALQRLVHTAQYDTRAHFDTARDALSGAFGVAWPISVAQAPNIVFDGDSLTATGTLSTYAARVTDGFDSRSVINNVGVVAQTIQTMQTDAATQVDALLSATKPNILMVWGGTNDLFFGASAADTEGYIQTYCAARKTAGWTVLISTILPRSDASTPGTFETDRQAVNTWLRANYTSFANALVDVGNDATIGAAGADTNTVYFADLVHLTDAGYRIAAEYARDALAVFAGFGHTHDNTYLLKNSGQATDYQHFAAGKDALSAVTTTGAFCTAIGNGALKANTDGGSNTAVGWHAGFAITTGGSNTALGAQALKAATTTSNNTGVGALALTAATGSNNTAIGRNAAGANTSGSSNVAVGQSALASNTVGLQNVSVGMNTLFDFNQTAGVGNNTAVGYNTGRGITTGVNNTILGANVTGLAAALGSNIILANGTGTIKAQHDGTDWTFTGAANVTGAIKSSSATAGVGYATGAGGTITQGTSRTTGVTLDKVTGSITLVSAAGSASWQSFTVTNSTVAATDVIRVVQKSGTDKNMIHVTAVAAGSFEITFATTGGTTTEQPVFSFAVIKGVAA